jgi:hypothetical protein
MPRDPAHPYSAFLGVRRLASGDLAAVARATVELTGPDERGEILLVDDVTGRVASLDLRGTATDVEERIESFAAVVGGGGAQPGASSARRGPGRPKLGVVAKEVTLLPRHWAWLKSQRGSASATLRRLVDQARRAHEHSDSVRRAQDATYRFMSALVGDEPGFEEAMRALYRGDRVAFEARSQGWPPDVREHSRRLAADAFRASSPPSTSPSTSPSE